MDQKNLEICFSQGLPSIKFEIVEVQKHNFMLKTKDSHVQLFETLENWLQISYKLRETGYSAML